MTQPAAPAPWYSIRKPSPETVMAQGFVSAAEIFIYGDIGESWWAETVSAAQFVKDLAALDAAAATSRWSALRDRLMGIGQAIPLASNSLSKFMLSPGRRWGLWAPD